MHRDSPMSLKTIGNKIQEIIDKELVANKDPDSRKAADLLNKFLNDSSDERIEQLIRLYTLETGFYAALRNNPIPLALPLYMTLQTLQHEIVSIKDERIVAQRWLKRRSARTNVLHNSLEAFYKRSISHRRRNRVRWRKNLPTPLD